jgi:hypothetical protein
VFVLAGDDAGFGEPAEDELSGDDGLEDVGAVEAVHAVGAEDAFLCVFAGGAFAAIGGGLFVLRHFDVEVAVVLEFVGYHLHQFEEVLVFHVFAFGVEVEPDQAHGAVVDAAMDFLEVFAQFALLALLVDEVEECAVLVGFVYVFVGFAHDVAVESVVGSDDHLRAPLQIGQLFP